MGETLVRFSVPSGHSLEDPPYFNVNAAGAESNVAIGLARLGHTAAHLTFLPDSPLGRFVLNEIRRHGVDSRGIILKPEDRAGIYFSELGATPRTNQVIYDRAGSAFARAAADEFPWHLLEEATLLHTSGITTAVNAAASRRALDEADSRGIPVSFDLNYRHKLWDPHEARARTTPLLERVQILITTRDDATTVLGAAGSAEEMAADLAARFHLEAAVVTDGEMGAVACCHGQMFREAGYEVSALDRIGAGDAFAAGFLSGWLRGGAALGLRQGVALAALKHTYVGDIPWLTAPDLNAFLEGSQRGWR
ncbi:MAG: PfkB family carbohydrate kinase [Bacillota bacterium]